ncbi:unnamed protein product [Candidula unifasciata]|uniref:Amine oxidase n=1 Tax=Candidula unifasciata TaxID=100452 RepID=A0A8S3ZKE1_9EUPU|nr:unnamed protein product [Candidula unifasciata]
MSDVMTENNFDVIVVGAGISGLTAAFSIKKRDPEAKVVVLEGKDRVGGRTLTVPLISSTGTDYWDLGGQWIGRSQVHIIKLLEELGLKTYPQFIQGTKFQQLGETRVRSYTSEIPDLSLWALLDLHWLLTKLDRFQSELSVEDPCSHPRAAEWDAISLAAYLDRTLCTKGARAANEAAVRCILGCESSQISFLYYLLFLHMAGGIKNIVEATDFTAQEWKIQGGAQQISQILAERIGEHAVRLGDPVTVVQQSENRVVVSTAKGWTGSAPYIILAAPPKALEHIAFLPRLSEERVDFMKHMPMGNMTKVIVTYEKAFWRCKNQSGQIVSDGGEATVAGCPLGPLSITYDATSYNGCPALVGFLGGEAAVCWTTQTAKIRQKAVLDHFAVFFGPEVFTFLDYIEKNWNDEPFSWGAPVSYITPGGSANFAKAIRRPDGRIHFAGTETATSWSGYMSGAVQAGERSALEVLFRLKPSVLKEAEIPTVTLLSAQHRHNSITKEGTKSDRCRFIMKTIFSISLGLGLLTASVYIFKHYAGNEEVSVRWVRDPL